MRVLLVQPDIYRVSLSPEQMSPSIGMNLLAAVLRTRGHVCRILDPLLITINAAETGSTVTEQVIAEIGTQSIDVVAISAVLQTRIAAHDIARAAKQHSRAPWVVLGGPLVSVLYEEISCSWGKYFDCLVPGEGEEVLPKILKAFEGKDDLKTIRGVIIPTTKTSAGFSITDDNPPIEPLDKLPFPDYSVYPSLMPEGKLVNVSILASRGCEYDCAFCGTRAMWGRPRYRSAQNVLQEIAGLSYLREIKSIRIHDDTFGQNIEQAESILLGLAKKCLPVRLYAHSRVDIVTPKLLRLFKAAGGECFYYGLESGSARIRQEMGKPCDDDLVVRVCQATKAAGLRVGLFIMLGYPNETHDDLSMTYRLLERISPDDIACAVVKIQPGTRIYRAALERGMISTDMWTSDRREFFTFLSPNELDQMLGVELVLYERFGHAPLRTAWEKNNDLTPLWGLDEKAAQIKQAALMLLKSG